MNADGSNPIRLTFNEASDSDPAWSSNGAHIAFQSIRDGTHQIYIMNADGSNQTRVTFNEADDFDPSWYTAAPEPVLTPPSPAGKISFSTRRDGNYEIYIMNADGSSQTRVTFNEADDFNPAISPDGARIVFGSRRDGVNQIYTMNVDGSNLTRLTFNVGIDSHAA